MTNRWTKHIAAPIVAGIATTTTLATIGPVFSDQNWLLTSVLVVASVVVSMSSPSE